jgi:hypothetical protein
MKPLISVTALGALIAASLPTLGAVGTLMYSERPRATQPTWFMPVAIGAATYVLLLIMYVLILRTRLSHGFGARYRERGKDPMQIVGMLGIGAFACPASAALLLFLVGLPLRWLWIICITSAVATMTWSFTYRPRQADNVRGDSARPA